MFETEEIDFFRRILQAQPAPVVLDIGANVGINTLAWATCRPDARVYAFEPSMSTAAILDKKSPAKRPERPGRCIWRAVSDCVGVATFHECDDNA